MIHAKSGVFAAFSGERCPGRRGIFFTAALVFFVVLICPLAAQVRSGVGPAGDPWWLTLEQGKRQFRSREYGEALRLFENARDARKNAFAKMQQDFITLLSIHEVRRLGDDLALVEIYIKKEGNSDAARALEQLYYRVPRDSLHNSAKAALDALGRLRQYPEAEYWIGEVYRVEGEFGIALEQYKKANDHRNLLETPGFATEILYKIADLRRMRREYVLTGDQDTNNPANPPGMVKTLEAVIASDSTWTRESFDQAAMIRALENSGVNRFLALFRHNNAPAERAYRQLGLYYYSQGRYDMAQKHLLFDFLVQNTIIINRLISEKYDYAFTTLDSLYGDIQRRPDLRAYIDDVSYFRVMYYLANSCYGTGKSGAAREIWTFLRDHPAGEWSVRAAVQLRNPQLEPVPGTSFE